MDFSPIEIRHFIHHISSGLFGLLLGFFIDHLVHYRYRPSFRQLKSIALFDEYIIDSINSKLSPVLRLKLLEHGCEFRKLRFNRRIFITRRLYEIACDFLNIAADMYRAFLRIVVKVGRTLFCAPSVQRKRGEPFYNQSEISGNIPVSIHNHKSSTKGNDRESTSSFK